MGSIILEADSQIGIAITPAELDVESPIRSSVNVQENRQTEQGSTATAARAVIDPPAGYVELPADPAPCPAPVTESTERPQSDESEAGVGQGPQTKQFKPYRSTGDPALVAPKTTERQRNPSLQKCPPCLEPGPSAASEEGRPKGPPRAATWGEESSKKKASGSASKRLGFGSGWWSGTDITESTLSGGQMTSPTDLSTTGSSETPTTISPLSHASFLSSQTSLSSKDVLGSNQLARRQNLMSQVPAGPASPLSPESSLSPRTSNSSMSQLLARHALLESRRQILLRLQEIDQEQEQILEKLAAMPEE